MSNYNSFPIGGIDYPPNFAGVLTILLQLLLTEEACIVYLKRLRWPDGFICPICHGRKCWHTNTGLIRCTACQHKISVIAGTIFQGTRKPLKLWFQAMWYITSQKFGGNALGLKRVLGLGSYQTAWSWLHKMRFAMVRPERERLSGNIEIDGTLVGGEEHDGKRGRGAGRKSIVVIAVEIYEPKGFGRVRMQRIPDASGRNLIAFACNSVEPGATILTDSWRGYNALQQNGYKHRKVNLSESGDPAHVVLPGVHRISSLLKRWIIGTLQGSISNKHLDYYLDEYTSYPFSRSEELEITGPVVLSPFATSRNDFSGNI